MNARLNPASASRSAKGVAVFSVSLVAAALALCALAGVRAAAAGKAIASARTIRTELRSGPLAAQLAAERDYRAALGMLVADAARRGPAEDSASNGARLRPVRNSALLVEERDVPFLVSSGAAFVAALDEALAGGGTAVALSADALPGGHLRGTATIRRFHLP